MTPSITGTRYRAQRQTLCCRLCRLTSQWFRDRFLQEDSDADKPFLRGFASMAVLSSYIGLLSFLRAYPATGAIVQMIFSIVKDMQAFSIILAISMVAFFVTFMVLLPDQPGVVGWEGFFNCATTCAHRTHAAIPLATALLRFSAHTQESRGDSQPWLTKIRFWLTE